MKPSIVSFNSKQIRISGTWDNPRFVLTDICKVLGLSNPSEAAKTLDSTDVCLSTIEGKPLNLITESGLYRLIFQSRKPEAKAFKRWVTSEVLPAIRRTGQYQLPTVKPLPDPVLKQQVIDAKNRLKEHLNGLESNLLTDDMKTFMHIYTAISELLWGMNIATVKSHLGLTDRQHRYIGKWWGYLDDENLYALTQIVDNAPDWIDSLAKASDQIKTHGEYWITSTGFECPTLRRGEIEIPEKPLLLIA